MLATTMTPEVPCVLVVKKKYPVLLPYVRGISGQLRKVFRSFDIPAYFKPTNTLWQLLVQLKDKVEKRKVVVPVMTDAMYLSETEGSLKAQLLEHRRKKRVGSEVALLHAKTAYL